MFHFSKVRLAHTAYHLSDDIVSSAAIEDRLAPLYQRLKLPEGRLELMTGIKERRMWEPGTRPSTLSATAAENLFKQSGFERKNVDLLIHASVCRDFLEPSTASVIHHELGLSQHAMIFDLSNACLGVINAVVTAAHMIEKGSIRSALIVSGENGGPLLEQTIKQLLEREDIDKKRFKKFFANLTIGSAATAWLLTHEELAPDAPKIVGGEVRTDSSANVLCQGDGSPDSLTMETDSELMMVKGVELAKQTWGGFIEALNWSPDAIDWVFTHQVGRAHEDLTLSTLGLKEHKTYRTYPYLGNTGSAALPITLCKALEQNDAPKSGDRVALLGIGSGLTSIMLGVQW
jgi:3-oxoacyl-[acyl-carrier-protein] synthase-3